MAIEFLHGRPLEPEELELIRRQIESGFDDITEIDPEIRGIVERNWPHCWPSFRPTNDRYSAREIHGPTPGAASQRRS
jgi:hypothetical protein